MPRRRQYDEPLKGTSNSSTLFYLKSTRPVPKGWIRYVTFATAYDDSQNSRNIEFGKLVGDKFHSLEGTGGGTRSIPTWFTELTHHFLVGQIPAFRFTNATSGNVIYGYLEGYEVEIEDGQ